MSYVLQILMLVHASMTSSLLIQIVADPVCITDIKPPDQLKGRALCGIMVHFINHDQAG